MRKSVVAGILAAVVGLVALVVAVLWDHGGSGDRAELRQGPEDAPATRAKSDLTSDPAWRRELASRPLQSAPDLDAETAQSKPVVADADDTLRVLVVEEATGFPVPGAEVAWCDERADSGRERQYPPASRLVSDFEHAVEHTVADGHGIAFIRTSAGLGLAARLGNMFGYRRFATAPRGEVRIAIAPGFFIAAKVVNDAGAPVAGIPVLIDLQTRRGRSSSGRTVIATSRSPDGIAVGLHTGVGPEEFVADKVDVKAQIEGMQATARTVPLDKLKEGPITLVMGATGRVSVKLKGPDGQPLPSSATVRLDATKPGKGGGTLALAAIAPAASADFLSVPIGLPLSISAESDGYDSPLASAATLSVPGEEQTVELRFVRGRARLKGRAIDDQGATISARPLRIEIVDTSGAVKMPAGTTIVTDAAGEFSIWVDRQLVRGTCELEIELRNVSGGLEGSAVVSLPKLSDSEETSLGDVRLARAEPLASGTVVDDLGAPVAGAIVYPETLRISQRGAYSGPGGGRTRGPRDSTRTVTDASGRFELLPPAKIRGVLSTLVVTAELPGYVCPEPPTVKPGAKDVQIVLRATGILEGRLLLPEPAPVRKLIIEITRPTGGPRGGPQRQRFEDCIDSNGRFRISNILPGAVTVMVCCAGVTEPLFPLGEITIPRLAAPTDARLAEIDLREHSALRR